MSTKQLHTMWHYAAWCREAQKSAGDLVSAGQVAKLTGTAISTAKRWLNLAVEKGELISEMKRHRNGILYQAYGSYVALERGRND